MKALRTISVDPNQTPEALANLLAQIRQSKNTPLCLDLSAMGKASTLFVQLLLAVEREWSSDGVSFVLDGVGDGIDQSFHILGANRLSMANQRMSA